MQVPSGEGRSGLGSPNFLCRIGVPEVVSVHEPERANTNRTSQHSTLPAGQMRPLERR
jgi:hypothetical protein